MNRCCQPIIAVLPLLIGIAPALAEPAVPLAEKVVAAYESIQTYAGEVTYSSTLVQGRWTRTERTTVPIAFDRKAQKLRVDRPGLLLVADGSDVMLAVEQIPGAYLNQPLTRRPMDYSLLGEVLPALHEPTFPDLVMLLATEPWAVLARGGQPTISEPGPDDAGNPRLQLDGTMGRMTLTLDPKTHLITAGVFTHDPKANRMPDGVTMTERFVITTNLVNVPLGDDAFAFDTANQTRVDSIQALAQVANAPRQHPLVGKPAPDLMFTDPEGNDVALRDVKQSVVVLDFWAAWCGPCHAWAPQVDGLNTWALKQGLDVGFYAVSVNVNPDADREMYAKWGLKMPLLFAADIKAVQRSFGDDRGLPLPTTAIIHNGKVIDIYAGVGPNTLAQLKAAVEQHAAKVTE